MRNILLSVAFICLATPSLAQGMPNSLTMTCQAAQALVRQQGAVVIATGPNLYDRYVADARYCDVTQTTRPAWVQTSDRQQCPVGDHCMEHLMGR